ncbi:MAG: ABC transporter substrate binding protein [Bacteroidales bacterium]|nr:ABC transporter substrate binding protein [Bacteroidales bacterium]
MKCFRIVFTLLSLFVFCKTAEASSSKEYVLIINSYTEADEWGTHTQNTIIDYLKRTTNSTIYLEYLDECVFPSLSNAYDEMNHLYSRYSVRPKVVVIIGEAGWIAYRSTLPSSWKNIPIVLTTVRDFTISLEDLVSNKETTSFTPISFEESIKGFEITGVYNPLYIKETILLMKQLMPEMKRIAFISDKRYVSVSGLDNFLRIMKEDFPELVPLSFNLKYMSADSLLNTLTQLDRQTGVLCYGWYTSQSITAAGVQSTAKLHRVISNFTNTPVFSLIDIGLSSGQFAGGVMSTSHDYGEKTGELVVQILNGKKVSEIPFQRLGNQTAHLNYDELKRGGIDLDLLPDKAIYYQRPLSFYEQHMVMIYIFCFSIFVIWLVLIIWIAYLRRTKELKQKEIEFLSKYKDLYYQNEELKQLLSSIIDNIPIPVFVKEVTKEIRILYVNKKAEEFLGVKSEQVIGKLQIDAYGEELGAVLEEEDQFMIEHGGFISDERPFVLPDKRKIITRVEKALVKQDEEHSYIIATRWDITEQKAILHKLEETNHRLSEVMNVGDISSWTWKPEIAMVFIERNLSNKTGELILNQSSSHTVQEMLDRIHPDYLQQSRAIFRGILEGEAERFDMEYRLDYDGSGYKWYGMHGLVTEKDPTGKPLTVIGCTIDISKSKQVQQELIEAKERAEESDRVKTAFLESVSHEIRTPLNAIVGFSRILASSQLEEDEKNQYADIIESNNNLLLQIINDILDLSQLEFGTFNVCNVPTDIHLLFNELVDICSEKIDTAQVSLTFEKTMPVCIAVTDRNRLFQVLENLLSNAIKFTKQGSIIMGYKQQDDTLFFYVKDTGCGIPYDQQDEIFERFVKLDSFVQGTGLGLPICSSIVRGLGGKIGVESEPGVGSTFWFTIPGHFEQTPEI